MWIETMINFTYGYLSALQCQPKSILHRIRGIRSSDTLIGPCTARQWTTWGQRSWNNWTGRRRIKAAIHRNDSLRIEAWLLRPFANAAVSIVEVVCFECKRAFGALCRWHGWHQVEHRNKSGRKLNHHHMINTWLQIGTDILKRDRVVNHSGC